VSGACQICAAGQTACPTACANLTNDRNNCGTCGHSCLSGDCVNSACQPFAIASNLTGLPGPLQLDGANLFWTEADTSQVFVLDTGTLVLRPLFNGLRVAYRPDGNTMLTKFGSSFTRFRTCSLAANCATMTDFSPDNTTGGDFQVDEATQRLFYVDISFPDMVQATSMSAFNPAPFLTLPVGFGSATMLGLINGVIYGTATPNAGGPPFALWRSASAPATNTASILSTQIPGTSGSLPLSANATKIFLFSSTFSILSFPPNGSGNAPPTVYFAPGAFGGMVADDNFVYWTDSTLGNVYRCPVAACPASPGPEIIASGQAGNQSLVQDGRAIYWGRAGQMSGLNQVMRLAK
jgi:hypothetical protein